MPAKPRWYRLEEAIKWVTEVVTHNIAAPNLREDAISASMEALVTANVFQLSNVPKGYFTREDVLIRSANTAINDVKRQAAYWGRHNVYMGGMPGDLITVHGPDVDSMLDAVDSIAAAYYPANIQSAKEAADFALTAVHPTQLEKEDIDRYRRLVDSYPDFLALEHGRRNGTFNRRIPPVRRYGKRTIEPIENKRVRVTVKPEPKAMPEGMAEYLAIQEKLFGSRGAKTPADTHKLMEAK